MRSTVAVVIGFGAAVFLNSPALAAASPASGVNVSLNDVLGKPVATVVTDGRGVARFAAVPPGNYRLTARYVLPQTQASNLKLSKSNVNRMIGNVPLPGVAIDLSAGKTHTSELTVPAGAPQPVTISITMDTSVALPAGSAN